jgi:hypothetical protein
MDANSLLVGRFKAQCNKFSGIISKGLPKTKRRLIKEMVYGIQASKDVKLSNISRAIEEEDIPLLKTEDRLSRNLDDQDFTADINEQLMRLGKEKVDESMVIAIDPGDIMKPYAKAMEYLCPIYDGSEHQKATGYHLCQVTAANLQHDKIVPLYCEAYSSEEEGYVNATEKLKSIITTVKNHIGTQGVWAIDRQGDNAALIGHFVQEQLQFVTRLKQNRYLHLKKNAAAQVQACNILRHVTLNHRANLMLIENGKERFVQLKFGAVSAALPDMPEQWFTLLVITGFGSEPMLLLTNLKVSLTNSKQLYRIVEIYLTRWKCDECYRYIKQSYNLEDIRVRSYTSIRNISVLVHAIAYFTSIFLGVSLKLKLMVQKIFLLSKRLFGVPTFFNYAMADGIYELLKKTKTGILKFIGKRGPPHQNFQLDLFPD